jgi:hypothetical protein
MDMIVMSGLAEPIGSLSDATKEGLEVLLTPENDRSR